MNNIPQFDWSVNQHSQSEVVIKTIKSVEETRQALQLLQQRRVVILILDQLSVEQAQRVVDWMAGGTCAIDGQTFWVSEKTFMFVPNQVAINSKRPSPPSVSPCLKLGNKKIETRQR
ncbi:cell division protein SepF [Crocosphaera sp. XPORK-15E]|uniref:cell division protein SepF n=1 Tax=Crocosphaera sp. XPORK-15E TaxID=3110247 RepID=UPI002B21BADA|nr:cell division protein SepF [Crocosphaera sp. XPORK-15E]MEA5534994.1 cell division protein SepF [Crocosphaera sp. XPORK-15E]